MRDQCGVIFRQAKKELEAAGLLNSTELSTQKAGTNNGEESLALEIDKQLEVLKVHFFRETYCYNNFKNISYYISGGDIRISD